MLLQLSMHAWLLQATLMPREQLLSLGGDALAEQLDSREGADVDPEQLKAAAAAHARRYQSWRRAQRCLSRPPPSEAIMGLIAAAGQNA